MSEEFNLSNESCYAYNNLGELSMMYLEEDVKEFIRLLKDAMNKDIEFCKKADILPSIHPRRVIELIDKLAGDKLI